MSASPGARERNRRRTHEQLAFAAVELFAERGSRHVRVDDICERVGLGRATFFRYFESKEAAFVQGVHLGRLEALLRAIEARPATEDPLSTVRNAMHDAFADWREHRENLLLEARIRAESPSVQAWAEAQHAAWTRSIAGAVATRCGGDPADMRPQLVAGVAMTALRVASDRWLTDDSRRSPDTYLDESFDAIGELADNHGGAVNGR
jgi:AcrR family transcriptional regulator